MVRFSFQSLPLLCILLLSCDNQTRGLGIPGGELGGEPGGGGGGGTVIDSGTTPDEMPQEATLSGLACAINDLRFPEQCASHDFSPLQVTNGDISVDISADNNFTFDPRPLFASTFELSNGEDNSIITSNLYVDVETDSIVIPVVLKAYWNELITTLGLVLPDSPASIVMYIKHNGQPSMQAEIQAPTESLTEPYYENGSPTAWSRALLTGVNGVVFLPSIQSSASTGKVIVVLSDGTNEDFQIPLKANSITFFTVNFITAP